MIVHTLKTVKEIKIGIGDDGSMAFVTRDEELVKEASEILGRKPDGLLLKVFHFPAYTDIKNFKYGKLFNFTGVWHESTTLIETIKIQNLFAFYGIAPKVFGIFLLQNPTFNTTHYAVLTEDCGDADHGLSIEERTKRHETFYKNLPNITGLRLPFKDYTSSSNIINGKLVDWQCATYQDDYIWKLRERYLQKTGFGDSKYQTVPELDIQEGIRKTDIRIKDLGLDKIDFKGKTVVDVGCSGGNFINYAWKQGAKRTVGVDWYRVLEGTMELATYFGNFNADFYPADLSEAMNEKVLEIAPFDICFLLSMTTHIGIPEYLHSLSKMMVLEINHEHQVEETLAKLKPYWHIKFIGKSTDFGDRNIYHCFNVNYFKKVL